MDLFVPLLFVLGISAVIALLVLKRLNEQKSPWGINTAALSAKNELRCPNCNSALPKARKPANLRQLMWGGFTCASCGKEYDKWLKEVQSS